MRRIAILPTVLLCLGLLACAGPDPGLERAIKELQVQQTETADLVRSLKHWYDEQIRLLWSQVRCDQERVREFLHGCQQGDQATCTPGSGANALAFMNSQPYVLIHMKSGGNVRRMHSTRRGELMQIVGRHNVHPSTRYLVLVQPRSDKPEDTREATSMADTLIHEMRVTLKVAPGVDVLGPYLLPCKLKRDQVQSYGGQYDRPLPNEPSSSEPHIRLWVFSTDC